MSSLIITIHSHFPRLCVWCLLCWSIVSLLSKKRRSVLLSVSYLVKLFFLFVLFSALHKPLFLVRLLFLYLVFTLKCIIRSHFHRCYIKIIGYLITSTILSCKLLVKLQYGKVTVLCFKSLTAVEYKLNLRMFFSYLYLLLVEALFFCLISLSSICRGCNIVSQCCNSYEFCVSCCVNPKRVISYWIFCLSSYLILLISIMCLLVLQTDRDLASNIQIAKPVTAGKLYFQRNIDLSAYFILLTFLVTFF